MKLVNVLLTTLVLTASTLGYAQDGFPSGPVKLIVATSPGAGMDATARLVAEKLALIWRKPVIVENRPGGSGAVAMNAFKGSKTGETLLVGDVGLAAISPSLSATPSYEPRTDLLPITDLFRTSFIFVARPEKYKSLADLVASARKQPGVLNYGSAGVSSGQRLSMEQFKSQAELKIAYIPFKGNSEALTALLGGDIDVVSIGLQPVRGHLDSGRLKALASTGKEQSEVLKDVPTVAVAASLPGYAADTWVGLFAHPGTSSQVATKIQQDVRRVMQLPDVQAFFKANDYEAGGQPPSEFAKQMEADRQRYAKLIRDAKISNE